GAGPHRRQSAFRSDALSSQNSRPKRRRGSDRPFHPRTAAFRALAAFAQMSRKLQFGDFELTVLSDGTYRFDGGVLFGIVPKVLWHKRMPVDEQNRVTAG